MVAASPLGAGGVVERAVGKAMRILDGETDRADKACGNYLQEV